MLRFILLLASLGSLAATVSAEQIVLHIDTRNVGAEIPSDYIGLSYEMSMLLPDSAGRHLFSPDNQPLINLYHTLGVKSLRVGGNTADRPSVKMPSRADIDSLFDFARAADVKVLYTLRFNEGMPKPLVTGPVVEAGSKETLSPYDPRADAAIAKYILDHYSDHLACFIIGNEIDHYYPSYSSFHDSWMRFEEAVTAPGARFCGPSTTGHRVAWAADFARDFGHDPRVVLITQHQYPAGSGRIKDVEAARQKLLSPAMEHIYQTFFDAFVPAVEQAGQHYRLEECNSFSNGGAHGVSDAFAAALWAVDYMYWWAEHGANGLNFHTSGSPLGGRSRGSAAYAVCSNSDGGYATRPIGYGMKAFDLGSHGRMAPVKSDSLDKNVRAYAVRSDDGALYVTIVNKNHEAGQGAVDVVFQPDLGFSHGKTIVLTAPADNVDAKTGITLGGAAIADDGSWHGAWSDVSPRNGHFALHIAPASVAVIKFTN